MKAINVNGKIKTFNNLKSYGGSIGLQYASDTELESKGFFDVVIPTKKDSQDFGDIEWDSDNNVFTYPLVNKTYTQTVAELKSQKIASLKSLYNRELAKTDWYVIRSAESDTQIPDEISTERNNLRTDCATKENEILALKTKVSIVNYQLPIL